MDDAGARRSRQTRRTNRRRIRTEKIETALVVALAGLVLFKGAPVVVGVGLGVGEILMDLMRL